MTARFILTGQRWVVDTDVLIKDGEIATDSSGSYIHISGDDELVQQAYIRIFAKLGGFVYNRELGSEIYKRDFSDENFAEKINLMMAQALKDCPKVKAEVISYRRPKIKIRLSCNSSVREETIDTDDYVR
nr:MAG TPA: Protein of unknown function (DUF2634) [Caudoviricetes sp.]